MRTNRTVFRILVLAVVLLEGNAGLAFSEDPLDVLLGTAAKYVDAEKYQKAFTLYQRVEPQLRTLSETVQARIYNNMGFCAFKLRIFGEAASYYRQALNRKGDYVICLNNMAALLMNQKKYQEALAYLKRADAIDKRNIKVLFNMAVCLGYQRNERESLVYMKRAFELDEDYTYHRLRSRHISDKYIRKLRERIRNLERDENQRPGSGDLLPEPRSKMDAILVCLLDWPIN